MPEYRADDGEPLHYDEVGSGGGAPLVVLAGGAARHPSYLGDLAGLGAGRRLVVPHLRGVGRSPLPDDRERASFWRQADDAEALRVHLGLDRLGVVAHSAGTRLAANTAFFSVGPPADLVERLAIDAPVLVLAGAGDCIVGVAQPVALAGRFRSGTAATIDRCGHYPWVERPEAFRRAIDPAVASPA